MILNSEGYFEALLKPTSFPFTVMVAQPVIDPNLKKISLPSQSFGTEKCFRYVPTGSSLPTKGGFLGKT